MPCWADGKRQADESMVAISDRIARPELKALVAQASQALALMDAERLQELACSCAVLNRELMPAIASDRSALEREAREAAGEMAILGRVLDATRENIRVMRRLRELRTLRLEYGNRGGNGNN